MPCINYECLFNAFTIKGQQQPQLIFIQIFDSIFLFIFVCFLFFLLLWLKLFGRVTTFFVRPKLSFTQL